MIKVSIFRNRDGKYNGFEVCGHAGYAEHGQDIICAAVSILTINTINSLEEFTDCKFDLKENEKKGLISFKMKSEPNSNTELLLKSLVLGLTGISKEYNGEYIQIIFKEV